MVFIIKGESNKVHRMIRKKEEKEQDKKRRSEFYEIK